MLSKWGLQGLDIQERIKLAFACLLTAVGIPMILAGEEFGDQHDLFDANGNVTENAGKEVDPVDFSRLEHPSDGRFSNTSRGWSTSERAQPPSALMTRISSTWISTITSACWYGSEAV